MNEYIEYLEKMIEATLNDKDLQREHWAFCQALKKYREFERLRKSNVVKGNEQLCDHPRSQDIDDILEAVSRIERQVELIKQGKTEVGETGVNRLDVIKEKAILIRIIGKRMWLLHTTVLGFAFGREFRDEISAVER